MLVTLHHAENCPFSHLARIQVPPHMKGIPKKASREEWRQRMGTVWGRATCASTCLPGEATEGFEIHVCKIMKKEDQLRRTVCFYCQYKIKMKTRDINSKHTEWNTSLHCAWVPKLWACVGWQSIWGKYHCTLACSVYFSLGVHFWSLLETWL